MNSEMQERMIVAIDRAVRAAGAPSFEKGIRQAQRACGIACGLFSFANASIEQIHSIGDLREVLDSRLTLSESEETLLLLAIEGLPQMLRIGLTALAKKAASTLPPLATGRKRALTAEQALEALDYVSQLHRKGVSMPIAKGRAAHKFGCGRRTIDRLWKNRESLPTENQPTIQDLMGMVLKAGAADHWQVPTD